MKVSEAIKSRKTIRSFLDTAVENSLIKSILEKAARAPSGGNLQPWRIFVLNKDSMSRFKVYLNNNSEPDIPAYDIYPKQLKEPYRSSRYKVGEDMYSLLGIKREDKAGRFAQLAENYNFFGAPAAFFCFIDKQMGPPQWSDLGMFLQTFMLLAREEGLDTCPQEAWAVRPKVVTDFVGATDELMLFCGMAIGYRNNKAKINDLTTEREPINDWAYFRD